MGANRLITNGSYVLNEKAVQNKTKKRLAYEVMHMDRRVASISSIGNVKIFDEAFMPFDLYLEQEEEHDIETMMNNVNNFYHWCASRVLSLDRKYAKEILNSIGVAQAVTDKDRAEISLSYH